MFGIGLAVITAPVWLPVYLAVYTIGTVTVIATTAIIVTIISY